ncbi:MAG: CRISPR system precrRNA processing endoribonuclease RAMP protein Cas6 [Anaerolineae bacterium]|nr:CRISPR system precrRNA processing endoribonuclease RAMP protein Cas6 [Anaerolineae bacterium]
MLTTHQLHITCRALTPIHFNQHKGSAIRGALFAAIRGYDHPHAQWSGFCANKAAPHCSQCPVSTVCPVMRLVSTLDERGTFGRDAPRPYVINPPLGPKADYLPDEELAFDLLLVGEAGQLFPYVVLALDRLAHEGLGQRREDSDGHWRRGTAQVIRIDAVHPLRGHTAPVLREGDKVVQVPSLPVTHEDVEQAAAHLPTMGPLTLQLLTPLRLVDRGRLVKEPQFRPLIQRLLERFKSLAENFGGGPVPYDIGDLRDRARAVRLVEDRTRWVDLRGYSGRLGRGQEIGGLVGRVTYEADDWEPFTPWLVWGTLLHAGKNAVKGDGWFAVRRAW